MYDLSFVIHRFYLKRFNLPLSPPPLCTASFSQTLFFCSGFFYNFYYPLSKSPHDLSDPLSSLVAWADRSREEHFCRREEERESRRGHLKVPGVLLLRTECSRRIKCRMTNAVPRGKPYRSFTITIKPPVHKYMEKSVCVRYLRARLSTWSYAPFALRIRKFYSGAA